MTLKEFSRKYDIPYHVVYEVSYNVQPITTRLKQREWDEKGLFTETNRFVNDRIKFHRESLDRYVELKDRLEGVW